MIRDMYDREALMDYAAALLFEATEGIEYLSIFEGADMAGLEDLTDEEAATVHNFINRARVTVTIEGVKYG